LVHISQPTHLSISPELQKQEKEETENEEEEERQEFYRG